MDPESFTAPARLDRVMSAPCEIGILASKVTESTFCAAGYGVDCPISLMRNIGSWMCSGAASPATHLHAIVEALQGDPRIVVRSLEMYFAAIGIPKAWIWIPGEL